MQARYPYSLRGGLQSRVGWEDNGGGKKNRNDLSPFLIFFSLSSDLSFTFQQLFDDTRAYALGSSSHQSYPGIGKKEDRGKIVRHAKENGLA